MIPSKKQDTTEEFDIEAIVGAVELSDTELDDVAGGMDGSSGSCCPGGSNGSCCPCTCDCCEVQ